LGKYIPDEILDRIRQVTDVVSLVRESLPLKKAGSAYKALCPFHKEKTPSFYVNPERQIFKCFGCGAAGDVFSFVMKTEGVDFAEAATILAERARIELPQTASREGRPGARTQLYQVNSWAAETFHHWLVDDASGREALEYLKQRGVAADTIERFQLGYGPAGWDALLKAGKRKNFSSDLMLRAGLLSSGEQDDSRYDRFRHRLMFPIRDHRSHVIGFGARALDNSEPKYLNSPETPLFAKSRVLYGLDVARTALKEKRQAMVVEGYMDVIMLHQHGVTHAVGVLGTALTRDHVRLLRRYADEAVLVFDADSAGQSSADRSLDAFAAEELSARVVTLREGMDPDDFVRQQGAEAFLDCARSAPDSITHKLNRALAAQPAAGSALPLARALDDVLATVALMPNTVAQSLEIRKIATRSGLPENSLRNRLEQIARRERSGMIADVPPPSSASGREIEREFLAALVTYPDTVPMVRAALNMSMLRDDNVRALVQRFLNLSESSQPVGAAELLARTEEAPQRAMVEEIIARQPVDNEDPEAWCRKLLDEIEARRYRRTAAELHARVAHSQTNGNEDADRLLMEKLKADREAQRKRGKFLLEKKPS